MVSPERFPDQFSVLVRRDGHRLRVWVSGDIDMASRDLVDSMLKAVVTTSDDLPTEIRFNMSNVSFVDSNGVSILLAARKLVRDVEGSVVVVRPPAMLSRLLEITALTDQFVLEPQPDAQQRARSDDGTSAGVIDLREPFHAPAVHS